MINFILYVVLILIGGSGLVYWSVPSLRRHPNRWLWFGAVLNLGFLMYLAWTWWKPRHQDARRK